MSRVICPIEMKGCFWPSHYFFRPRKLATINLRLLKSRAICFQTLFQLLQNSICILISSDRGCYATKWKKKGQLDRAGKFRVKWSSWQFIPAGPRSTNAPKLQICLIDLGWIFKPAVTRAAHFLFFFFSTRFESHRNAREHSLCVCCMCVSRAAIKLFHR